MESAPVPGCTWWARDARGPRGAWRAAGGHAVGGAHVENGAAKVENATRTRPYAVNLGRIQRQGIFVRIPRTTATAVPEHSGRASRTPSRFARNLERPERDLFRERLQDCLMPLLADFCVAAVPSNHHAVYVWVSDPGYRRGLECQPILSSAARIIPAITGRGDARGRTSAPARKHAPKKKRQFIVGPPALVHESGQ